MRVPTAIEVKYKLISKLPTYQTDAVFSGELLDIDRQRAVTSGSLPGEAWKDGLLQGRVLMGLNIFLPSESVAIKILTNVEAVRPNPAGVPGSTDTHFVLNFREISEDHHRRIVRFIVGLYLRKPGS